MNYLELINNWHQKAASETTDDYFSKFVFEYLAFIAFLRTQLYPNTREDKDAIIQLKTNMNLRDQYLNAIEEKTELKESWKSVIDELLRSRLGNMSINSITAREINYWEPKSFQYNDKYINKDHFDLRGVVCGLDDWSNMINFWNAVRNNLFHGTKNPENPRDRFAVEYSYKTIKELVQLFLS